MILGKVIGAVWGTRKAPHLEGNKLLRVQPVAEDGSSMASEVVAVDQLDAGPGDMVLVSIGSRVRNLTVGGSVPTKAVVLGIVDGLAHGRG